MDNYSQAIDILTNASSQSNTGDMSGGHADPLTIKQNFMASLPSTVQGRYHALINMGIPAEIGADGKSIMVGGESWGDVHSPQDFVSNLPQNITRFVARNLPLLGSTAALALVPETGGASLGALTALSGAGALGGSVVQQLAAKQFSGEDFNAGEALYQTAMGAAGPATGKLLGKGAELGLKSLQKPLNIILKKNAQVFPEIAETLWGLERGNTTDMVEQFVKGRPVTDILSKTIDGIPISHPDIPQKLAQRVFANGDSDFALNSFVIGYKKHLANLTDSNDINLLDNVYKELFPKLKQETLDAFKKYDLGELLGPKYASDQSLRNIGKNISETLDTSKRKLFNAEYGNAIKNFYSGNTQLNINDDLTNLITRLGPRSADNPNALGILFSDGKINPDVVSPTEKKALEQILKTTQVNDKMIKEATNGKFGLRDWGNLPKPIQQEIINRAGTNFSNMPASKVFDIFIDIEGPMDTISKIGGKASVAITDFRNSLNQKLGQVNPAFKAVSDKYANFSTLKEEMGNLTPSSLSRMYRDGNLTSVVSELDQTLGTKLLPEVEKLGAAQDLVSFKANGLDEGTKKFINMTKNINNLKNPGVEIIRDELGKFEKVVHTPFLRDAKDYSIASELANKPTSWFRIRSLGFFLSASLFHQPILGMVAGAAAANPQNIARLLQMAGKEGAATAGAIGKGITKKATSKVGQAVLGKLLRKATGD